MSSQSTVTLQDESDIITLFPDLEPQSTFGGSTERLMFAIADDVMNQMLAEPFPFKFNEFNLPQFYTNAYQQDYSLVNVDGSSVYNIAWLERGISVNINNSSVPKWYTPVYVGRQLPQSPGMFRAAGPLSPTFSASWLQNSVLYYGTWGAANTGNSTLGNNPVAGSVYTNLVGTTGSTPQNPIQQIRDANGNLLVLTMYGTCGTVAPLASAGAAPGTTVNDGSVVWTVVDPVGKGIRLSPTPIAGNSVWQINLTAQITAPRFTSMQQTLDPVPDLYEPTFRAGMIANAYQYSPTEKTRAKFPIMWQKWLASLVQLRTQNDREPELNKFLARRGVMGGSTRGSRWVGPVWPYNYPIQQ
jgi:hypothetical protein